MALPRAGVFRFSGATPRRDADGTGVSLAFVPERTRPGLERIDDWADLGPDRSVPAVSGVGKVLRVLRAARVAAPPDPLLLVGREAWAAELLARAEGTAVRLDLRHRSRLRFLAWTEEGLETVDDVAEVREEEGQYVVIRRDGRFPVRFARDDVVRRCTRLDPWWEVLDIRRA